jgi:hypothetical protein
MLRIPLNLVALSVAGASCAQTTEILKMIEGADRPVRVPIRSADPWFIKMMLEGTQVTQPEYSTIQGVQSFGGGGMGVGFGSGNMGGGGFGGGGLGGGLGGQQQGFGSGRAGSGSAPGGQQGAGGGRGQQGFGGGGAAGGGAPGGGGTAGQGRGLLPPGWRVMVNPTDNSLWLIPVRQ